MKGIEPSYSAWKAAALPLSYTRNFNALRRLAVFFLARFWHCNQSVFLTVRGSLHKATRFNALRQGVLSRYTPGRAQYGGQVATPIAEHAPQGPTEEHLVEELAGIFWGKRRLTLVEAAEHIIGTALSE